MYGTCCNEMDIWEPNSISTAYTPHPCKVDGQYRRSGADCGDGSNHYDSVCNKCDSNSYRMGVTNPSLLWYLHVHTRNKNFRWIKCKAVLFLRQLQLTWVEAGGGKAIIGLDLLNVTRFEAYQARPTLVLGTFHFIS